MLFRFLLIEREKRWDNISKNIKIPIKGIFFIAINLVLGSTYFSFNKIFYKQIFDSPMSSPLSPIIANIVLEDLEEKVPTIAVSFTILLQIYRRYITCCSARQFRFNIKNFQLFPWTVRLQFTLEVGTENSLNFLDVSIIVDEHRIIFDTYKKSTFSERYLNFHSQHPGCHKRGVIYSLFDKIFFLFHPRKFHSKNIIKMIKILLQNGYSFPFIFSSIQMRIKFHSNKTNKITTNQVREYNKYLTVPFVRTISESFSNIAKSVNLKPAFTIPNTLKKYITTGKDSGDNSTSGCCL